MTDIVRYDLPFRLLGRAVHTLAVRRNVEKIFDYRYQRIHALLGAGERRMWVGSDE